MSFKGNLNKIINRQNLNQDEMSSMFSNIFSGEITDAQIGAFMAALATKGETFEELAGAARAMRRKAVRVQANSNTVVDTCGTGGDSTGTFNISTTTAFVVAGCGLTVAKHGNRSISSKCGSADLLEELGVKIDTDPEIVEEATEVEASPEPTEVPVVLDDSSSASPAGKSSCGSISRLRVVRRCW